MSASTYVYYPCSNRVTDERSICGVRSPNNAWYCSLDSDHPTEPHIAYDSHRRPTDADHCGECQLLPAKVLETWGIPEIIFIDELPV